MFLSLEDAGRDVGCRGAVAARSSRSRYSKGSWGRLLYCLDYRPESGPPSVTAQSVRSLTLSNLRNGYHPTDLFSTREERAGNGPSFSQTLGLARL